jgi:hypothetical protein
MISAPPPPACRPTAAGDCGTALCPATSWPRPVAAPHTRSGVCCRQPAMKNGRCRMHGGLSTGPRTAEGRARCAAARRSHGFYSAEMVALRRAGAACCRRMDAIIASLRIRRTAGHGVLPQDLRTATLGATPAQLAEGRLSRRGRPSRTRRGPPHRAAPAATTAGHGLLPQNPSNRKTASADSPPADATIAARSALSACPRLRGESSSARSALSAGHGVLPSLSVRPRDGARPSRERQGFVQRALLGGTALGLGVTVKPPGPALGQRIPLPTTSPECFNSRR